MATKLPSSFEERLASNDLCGIHIDGRVVKEIGDLKYQITGSKVNVYCGEDQLYEFTTEYTEEQLHELEQYGESELGLVVDITNKVTLHLPDFLEFIIGPIYLSVSHILLSKKHPSSGIYPRSVVKSSFSDARDLHSLSSINWLTLTVKITEVTEDNEAWVLPDHTRYPEIEDAIATFNCATSFRNLIFSEKWEKLAELSGLMMVFRNGVNVRPSPKLTIDIIVREVDEIKGTDGISLRPISDPK